MPSSAAKKNSLLPQAPRGTKWSEINKSLSAGERPRPRSRGRTFAVPLYHLQHLFANPSREKSDEKPIQAELHARGAAKAKHACFRAQSGLTSFRHQIEIPCGLGGAMRRKRGKFFSFPVAQHRRVRKPESADDGSHDFLLRYSTYFLKAAHTPGTHGRQGTRPSGCWLATPQSAQLHQAARDRHAVKVGVQQFFPHALWRCRNQDGISGPDVIRRHEFFKFQAPSVYRHGPYLEVIRAHPRQSAVKRFCFSDHGDYARCRRLRRSPHFSCGMLSSSFSSIFLIPRCFCSQRARSRRAAALRACGAS